MCGEGRVGIGKRSLPPACDRYRSELYIESVGPAGARSVGQGLICGPRAGIDCGALVTVAPRRRSPPRAASRPGAAETNGKVGRPLKVSSRSCISRPDRPDEPAAARWSPALCGRNCPYPIVSERSGMLSYSGWTDYESKCDNNDLVVIAP